MLMKKTNLKNWLIASSTVAIIGAGAYAYACAGGDWGFSYLSSFTPEAFADNSYKPMFYAPSDRFYDWGYMDNNSMHNERIVSDWQDYLGSAIQPKALEYYLLNDSIITDLDRITNAVSKGEITKTPYNIDLKNQKIKNFIQFLYVAKNIEKYASQTYNYWDYDNRTVLKADEKIALNMEQFYNKMGKTDAFYSNRMWFQVMKAKFYSVNQKSVIDYFNVSAKDQPRNNLYYRALAYVAGTYYNSGDFTTSNRIFAEVFNESSDLRQVALYNFKPMSVKELQNVLNQTADKDVQASIWAINGYYGDEAEALKEIYKLNPKSPHLNFLLTRWVNSQEDNINVYLDKDFSTTKDYFKEIKGKIDQNTLKWIDQVASKPEKLDNPVLWTLASGYLNIFQGEYAKAEKAFSTAKSQNKGNELVNNQIRMFNLINKVSQVKKIDTAVENQLLPDMKWLYKEVREKYNYESAFRYDYTSMWIKKYLAAVYKDTKQDLMAELVNTGGDFFLKESNSVAMEQFFLKKNKSPWEELFADLYQYNLSDIYESRAIYLFYENKIDDAITVMSKAEPVTKTYSDGEQYTSAYKDMELFGNPFNGKIKDCNDCDHQAKQSVKYSKLVFLQKVKEMQTKVANHEDVFNNAFLLGNAFYNASYFGNARAFYYNTIVGEYGSNYIEARNRQYLHSMKYAKYYYELAAKAAENQEQKAKMAYMLAKVERNEFYASTYLNQGYFYPYDDKIINFKAWKGFQDLKAKYADTQYYKDVIAECGYFRKYMGLQ